MREAITKRVSRRAYADIPIDVVREGKIADLMREVNTESGLNFQWVEDGSRLFNSFTKSYGMFKNVRSIVLLKGPRDDVNLKEKVGYYGEQLVLDLTDLFLGTCWVGVTFDKSKVDNIGREEELICVLTVGVVPPDKTFREKLLGTAMHRKVKSILERFTGDEPVPAWFMAGMEAVVKAPSSSNSQKAVFRYGQGQVSAHIVDDYSFALVDLGIAKRHFAMEAGGRFDWGNGGVFYKD